MDQYNIEAWVRSLKPDEEVTCHNPVTGENFPAKVIEVTPKGVVKTTRGEFKHPGIGDKVVGYNGTMGWLFPKKEFKVATAEQVKMGKRQKKEEVKLFCAAVVSGDVELSHGLVESLLNLKRRFA